jgi:hypothetical protein
MTQNFIYCFNIVSKFTGDLFSNWRLASILTFNRACTTGKLFLEILILKLLFCLLMVQSILNLSASTAVKSLTSSKLKLSVHRTIAGFVLSKQPSSLIQ